MLLYTVSASVPIEQVKLEERELTFTVHSGIVPWLQVFRDGYVAALFEEAAAELKPNPSQTASQKFRMYLALSSEMHQVRARIQIAAQQSKEGHPGASCADLMVGKSTLMEYSATGLTLLLPVERSCQKDNVLILDYKQSKV